VRSNKALVLLIVGAAVALPRAIFGQPATDAPENGAVSFLTSPTNEIVGLDTKLVVPALPAATGTLFLWPGLQPTPGGAHYMPIDNGVLQSVLSWGNSCAPGKQPDAYSTWWISGQYVNKFGHYSGYTDCLGGPVMPVDVGDTLAIHFSLFRSLWTQTIVDLNKRQSVSFHMNLSNQAQAAAWFVIEAWDGAAPRGDVTFLETRIAFVRPDPGNCNVQTHGGDDYIAAPVVVDDGQSCYIDKIVLSSKINSRPSTLRPPRSVR